MGQREMAERVGRIIHKQIPTAAADFLLDQPMIVIAAADDTGRIWTSLITGPAGFVHVDDAQTITVDGLPVADDPLHDVLRQPNRQVGMIAVQPQTRRRMRVNGVAVPTATGIRIQPDQVYSNCPKYISRRQIVDVHVHANQPTIRRTDSIDARTQRIICTADTFFVGSADTESHADASHRGGNPGFLQVLSPNRVRWPEFRGNSMFMTLGNIAVNPHCGLLIPDWATGSTIQLTGTAEIVFDDEPECAVEFTLDQLIEVTEASPLRWGSAELSPANPL